MRIALIVAALFSLDESAAVHLIGGSAVHLVGTIGLRIAYHVPRNEALATVDGHSSEAAGHWARHHAEWTAWNHVRTAAALAATAALTVAVTL
ncbi:anthrone oxygenase family protein [Pseudonocardia sp. H11422]|uniref:anthrone oxygenase family protein n=1 Tax=Pseudonocardia sp. H11422 TaxID=2835866 RepID=UPI001BDD37FA|nr:anthrone oxygenase family protein [Pseudonocardia sp. H11422]